MKLKIITFSHAVAVLIILPAIMGFTRKKKLSLMGAWSVVEVRTVKPDGTATTTFPRESLVLFSKSHYSFCWTSNAAASHSWALPDSLKLDRFNQSIVNTGTFELKDSVLTTKAQFAMNPMFVNGQASFKCSFSGDTLVLTGLNVLSAGNIPHPVYAGGARIISKLIRISSR